MKGVLMERNKKQSSSNMASKAAKVLSNETESKIKKQLAASVLSQTNTNKETGKELETLASNVLQSSKYSQETKEFAGSVLTQSNKKR